ncbi:MAG: hypothetical protein J6R04_01020 [Clostridia bacterium]|nr:hypothetical protein [Clostridia bacterium]
MTPSDMTFHRQWSMSVYKNQKLMLGKMTFSKDFVSCVAGPAGEKPEANRVDGVIRNGDIYPVLDRAEATEEAVADGGYTVRGQVSRLLCQFFPFATYALNADRKSGSVDLLFHLPETEAVISMNGEALTMVCDGHTESVDLPAEANEGAAMVVTCRPGFFDVYFEKDSVVRHHHTFAAESFCLSLAYKAFSRGYVGVVIDGEATVRRAEGYIDNGISLADLRSIRYENGDVMVEDGKVYLTASIRMHDGTFQGVFSWLPGTPELNLVGAIFYDAGDGLWCGDVAASILYHRENKRWMLWVCSFYHKHILAHAEFDGDPRFGVNVIDITLTKPHEGDYDVTAFAGYEGDEDPDFFYDAETGKWHMAICRVDRTPGIRGNYRYIFFESDRPFDGYTYVGQGLDGAETGGSFVRTGGETYFICGNGANSDYRIYSKDGMQNAKFDFPDGGYRGWGTLIPIKRGSRERYFWITFDRHSGSRYTWSYGDVYGFEGILE